MSSVAGDVNGVLKRRLRFPKDILFGREDELDQIFHVYRGLCKGINDSLPWEDHEDEDSDSSMAEMVLISGYSGTGKSSLVYQFRERLKQIVNSKSNHRETKDALLKPCWISGVFEDKKTDPYSAVASAFSSYFLQLIEEDNPGELDRVSTGIKKAIGKEGRVLTDVIPELALLIGEQPEASTTSTNEDSLNRLMFLFQSIVEVICRRKSPVILFLDDLQRADAASLDLLAALMTADSEYLGRHLMFVGCMRSNEVDECHPLSVSLQMIEKKRKEKPAIEIHVSNLSREAINHFLATTLSLDPNDTQTLTDVLYNKTDGNILYTKQALEQLNENNVLTYDIINTFRWVWDVQRIGQELALSDNVVEIIIARMSKFPSRLQKALAVAALLRSSFELSIVEEFMETDYMRSCLREESKYYDYNLVELLDIAVTEGLLDNDMGSTTYTFTHDRIQQAAYSLVPVGSARNELKRRLGTYLLKRASSDSRESMLFVAADLLNATFTVVPASVEVSSTALAKLNLVVGERAMSQSAFKPASCYFLKGLEALGKSSSTPWQSHYDLTLALHCSACNTELSIGDFDVGWRLAHTILRRARNLSEKLQTYMSLVDALGRQQRSAEAIQFVKEALELLGECPRPRRPRQLHIMKEAFGVKNSFRRLRDDQIMRLPRMEDPDKLVTMELLSQLTQRSYMRGDRANAFLSVFRQLKLTFRFGICGASAHALSCYGVILCSAFKDHEAGQRMGRLAKEILTLTKEERFKSRTLKLIAVFIDPWFVPLSSVMSTLSLAHASGLETGTFEHGFRAFFDFEVIAYAIGTSLCHIEKDCKRMLRLMEQYGMGPTLSIFREFLVLILNLTGTEKNNDWRNPFPVRKDPVTYFRYSWYCFTRMQLAYLHDEISLADEMSKLVLALIDSGGRSFVFISHALFFSGLIAAALANTKRNRKYISRAKTLRQKLNDHIVRTKAMNMLHKYLIVDAQYTAIVSRRTSVDKIRDAFDTAISVSSRSGFTQDAAIANELAGEYFLRAKDTFWANHYLTNAHQKYHDWGAGAKVEQLLRKHQQWIDTSGCLERMAFQRTHTIRAEACDKHEAVNLESLDGSSAGHGQLRV